MLEAAAAQQRAQHSLPHHRDISALGHGGLSRPAERRAGRPPAGLADRAGRGLFQLLSVRDDQGGACPGGR